METPGLTAIEQVEKLFLIHAIGHTGKLWEAAEMANMTEATLLVRRKKYNIPEPPPDHYTGARLTHDQMVQSFLGSLAPPAAPPVPAAVLLENSLNVTFIPPPASASSQPLPPFDSRPLQ